MAGIDSRTKLMLHCDGTDGSTTFTDDSIAPHTVTADGAAQIDTAQSKFGGASGLHDGIDSVLSVPNHVDWDFETGDFTIDIQVNFASISTFNPLCEFRAANLMIFDYHSSNGFRLQTGVAATKTFAFTASTSTWYHVMLVRSGTDIYCFVDGVQKGITETNGDSIDGTSPFLIGGSTVDSRWSDANFDEIRISKGVARQTSNFTSPTEAYTEEKVDIILPQFSVVLGNSFGNANITLPQFTVLATRGFRGIGSIALPIITHTFTGLTGSIDGTTLNLPAFTFSIRTGLTNSTLLPQLSLAGVGFSGFRGTYAKSLPRMTVHGNGIINSNGTFDVSLPAFTLDNILLTGNISLASTRDLPMFRISATGLKGENGDGAVTFPMFTMSNESYQSLNGTVVQSLKMLTLDAYGDSYTNRII